MRSNPTVPVECIFCGATGTTREHYWPKWTAKIAPDNRANLFLTSRINTSKITINNMEKIDGSGVDLVFDRSIKRKPRDAFVKCACRPCNNGWMSDIERVASRILIPIALGQRGYLKKSEIEDIRKWICLRVMIMELLQPETAVCKAYERTGLYRDNLSLPFWDCWIAKTQYIYEPSRTQTVWYITAMKDLNGALGDFNPVVDSNTKFTRIHVGRLMFCCFSSTALFSNPVSIPFPDNFAKLDINPRKNLRIPDCKLADSEMRVLGQLYKDEMTEHLRSLSASEALF